MRRAPINHVILLDGTLGSLRPGDETHVGRTYKLLRDLPASAPVSLYYEPGIQWQDWRTTHDVAAGRGINRQIRRAYGYLASRYRPGDRIFLIGYSRGAYAVRSLAGVIGNVGLLRAELATERNVRQAYRHYEAAADGPARRAFTTIYCHAHVPVEMVGVWDTVKALGLRLPLLWMMTEARHEFHDHRLGAVVRHGYHALALDERRAAFEPVLWDCPPIWVGRVEQTWFRGCHGDIGGQLAGYDAALPLAHIPLVWMLKRMERCDLPLPSGWRARFPCDAEAPSIGMNRGWGKLFLLRQARQVGCGPCDSVHPTARADPPMPPPVDGGLSSDLTPQG
jgi:uncharacterized protein (DUF2235 family)